MFLGLAQESLRPLVDTLMLSIKTDVCVCSFTRKLNFFPILQEVSLPWRLERRRSRCGWSGDEDGFDKTSRRRSRTEPRTRDDPKRELKKKKSECWVKSHSTEIANTLEFVYYFLKRLLPQFNSKGLSSNHKFYQM